MELARQGDASDKQGGGRHWAERRGREEEGKEEKMRVIVEDQGEQIRLNHLLSNDLRGHTQLAAEPKGLDSSVCASVCVEKLSGLSSPAAIVTVKLKNMAPVLEKCGCFNSSLVSTNSICAICIIGARGQLLLIFFFFAQPLND